jgi:hypothetical protein
MQIYISKLLLSTTRYNGVELTPYIYILASDFQSLYPKLLTQVKKQSAFAETRPRGQVDRQLEPCGHPGSHQHPRGARCMAVVNPRKTVIKSAWSFIAALCKDSADLNVESDFR